MAINRADIQARTFLLPEQQQIAAPRTGGVAGAAPTYDSKYFGIPDAAEGLQWTDNVSELSNQYFQKLTSLDQFAKSMWLNNKIDVTKPDRSNPQAFLASQAYQKELGNIMSLADELKQSQKDLTAARAAEAGGNFAMNKNAFRQGQTFASNVDQGQFTGLDQVSKEVVNNFSGARETPQIIAQQQQVFNDRMTATLAEADRLEASNPGEATRLRQQVQRMRTAQTMYENPPAVPSSQTGVLPQVSSLSNAADVLGGGAKGFERTRKIRDGFSEWRDKFNPFVGKNVAGKKVSAVLAAGDNTYFEFTDEKGNVSAEKLDPDNTYGYLVEAYQGSGEEPQLEKFMQAAVNQGLAEKTKTGLGYTFKVPLWKAMSDAGKSIAKTRKLEDEEMIPAAQEAVDKDLNSFFDKLKWWDEHNVKRKFQPTPEVVLPYGDTEWQVKISPQETGKTLMQIIDKSGFAPSGYDAAVTSFYFNPSDAEDLKKAKAKLQSWRVTDELINQYRDKVLEAKTTKSTSPIGQAAPTIATQEGATTPAQEELIEQNGWLYRQDAVTGTYIPVRKK